MSTQSQPSENTPFEMDFDQSRSAINIGSHFDNDIVLKGTGVRPFHVSLVLHDGECQVLPLDTDAVVRLDGRQIATAQFKLAGVARRLELGENVLLLEYNKTFDSLHVRINPAASPNMSADTRLQSVAQVASAVSPSVETPILLNLFSQTDEIEAGQTASYELEVVNAGALVASFTVMVEGVPKEWVSVLPEEINLYEGQRKRVHINITPPRHPLSAAGEHELRVSAFSATYPGQQADVPVFLRIKPYYEFTLGNLSPREQRLSSWARKNVAATSLPITNLGNNSADFMVSVNDDENGCSFDLVLDGGLRLNRQATLHVAPGQMLLQPIEITPRKRRWINGKSYPYTASAQITNQPVAPQMVGGSLSRSALFPLWSLALTALTLILVAIFVMQPGISSFRAEKDVIELGDTTKLVWSVSFFTTRVSISNTTEILNKGQSALSVMPEKSTTYEIVAGNWLSGLLNMDRREKVTILVVPALPKVNTLSVGSLKVAQGKSVKIIWSVTQADQAVLTVGDLVTELSKAEFSSEKDFVLKQDTLVTLDARNAGGRDLRSYFVDVIPPNIEVVTFAVWVKEPDTEKQGRSIEGGGKLAAPSPASPDPEFQYKYVELVPSGAEYRAVFHQKRELDKGEAILVEWNIIGADNGKVQISPFADSMPLPAKGSEQAFPDEAMSFVLTAKSGELERIFMLPVKVFTGAPPAPPKIDFFQAVPVSNTGPIDVEFAWSVSGACDKVQLANGEQIWEVGVQGPKTINVSKSGTYILTAWNGELSAAQPVSITINPKLVDVALTITSHYPDSDQFLVGSKITVSIDIKGKGTDAKGKPYPTGDVTVTDGVATCAITLPALSCDLVFKSEGDKQLWASYGGDTIYSQGKSPYYPPDKKIHVSSPTVMLTPNFFLTDATGSPIGGPIVVTNQQFKMDQKLYVRVTVTPSGAVLPPDGNNVSLSICEQGGACDPPIAALVKVNPDGTGTANILISHFPGAGEYILRFDYRQDNNLLAPADYIQRGVRVSKLGIYLTLPPSPACSNLIADGATCSFSYKNPTEAHILFDIHQTTGNDYLDTFMPEPVLTFNKNQFWRVYDVTSNNPFKCEIKNRSVVSGASTRSVYILDCTVNVVGKAELLVNYDYVNSKSPDYFMGSDPSQAFSRRPFKLQPTKQTTIKFNASNYYVGQIISLTPMADLRLYPANSTRDIADVTGKITFTSNPPVSGLFGVVPESTCVTNTVGDAVLNIDVDEKCQIFFRKAGVWNVQIDFSGDDNNASSSASVSGIRVEQKAVTTMTWYYSDNNTANPNQPWSDIATIGTLSMTGRVVFDFGRTNDMPFSVVFSNKAFEGARLSLTKDTDSSSCALNQPNPPIVKYQASTQQAVFDFVVTCQRRPSKVKLTLGFDSIDRPNFGAVTSARQVLFSQTKNIGGIYFEFAPGNNFNFNWQSATPSTKTIPVLYAGETYTVHLMYQPVLISNDAIQAGGCSGSCNTLDDVLDFIQYDNKASALYRKVNIKFPDSWAGRVASVNGRCSLGADNKSIVVPLSYRRNFPVPGWSGWSYVELSSSEMLNSSASDYRFNDLLNPCTVTFGFTGETESNLPLGKNGSVAFLFVKFSDGKISFNEPTTTLAYSADENYVARGLTKAFVESSLSEPFKTRVFAGSPRQTVTMTLSNPDTARVPLTDYDLPSHFDVGHPSCMSLSGVITSSTTVEWTMTPATSYPCAGTLSIYYKENIYFGRKMLVSQPVQFANPATPTPGP